MGLFENTQKVLIDLKRIFTEWQLEQDSINEQPSINTAKRDNRQYYAPGTANPYLTHHK